MRFFSGRMIFALSRVPPIVGETEKKRGLWVKTAVVAVVSDGFI